MFGLGWAEILVAGIVGLIVIGPKELPVVFRKIGQFVGKAKGMARDFSRAMNDAADESGMKDAMDSVNSLQDGVRSVTDPTTKWKDFVPGSETAQLAEERAEKSKKMHDAMAVKAQGRLVAELKFWLLNPPLLRKGLESYSRRSLLQKNRLLQRCRANLSWRENLQPVLKKW